MPVSPKTDAVGLDIRVAVLIEDAVRRRRSAFLAWSTANRVARDRLRELNDVQAEIDALLGEHDGKHIPTRATPSRIFAVDESR